MSENPTPARMLDQLRHQAARLGIELPPLLVRIFGAAEDDADFSEALETVGLELTAASIEDMQFTPMRSVLLRQGFLPFAKQRGDGTYGLYLRPDAPGPPVVCKLPGYLEHLEIIGHGFEAWFVTHLDDLEDADTREDPDLPEAIATLRAVLPGRGAPWRAHGTEARTALVAGDVARAKAAAARMRAVVSAELSREGLSATLGVEALVAEAEGDLAGAARALRNQVDLAAHTEDDTREVRARLHRDLGFVEEKAGRHEEAVEAMVRAGDLFTDLPDPTAVTMFAEAARIAFVAGDHETAERLTRDAVAAGEAQSIADETDVLRALTLRGRIAFADGESEDALSDLMEGSRRRCADTPASRRARADLWLHVGEVSQALAMRHLAAASYATVLALTDDEALCEPARKGIAYLGELFEAPLDGFWVVHLRPAGGAYVMNAFQGLHVDPSPAREKVGDRVRVSTSKNGIARILR